MKRALLGLMAVLLMSAAAMAQSGYTPVTATIPSYAGGSVLATFQNQGGGGAVPPPTVNGNPIPTQVPGTISSAGVFNITVADNLVVSQQPSCWVFTIRLGSTSFQSTCIPITGSSPQDISSAFSGAPAPGGLVTQIIAGTNVNISPSTGQGAVTINATPGVTGVTSFNTRTGAVSLENTDISGAGGLLAANNLSDLTNVSQAQTNLGLGSMATQSASSVSITGGSLSGVTLASPTLSGTVSGNNTVPLSILAQSGANTMLGNWSGSTANVSAQSMPTCTAATCALNYTPGSGITTNTSINAAQLGGKSATGTSAGIVTGPTTSVIGDIATFNDITGGLKDSGTLLSSLMPNVFTTLGDLNYGGSSGTPTRLAGSTSSSLAVLTQTGTGSASAAPVWSTAPAWTTGQTISLSQNSSFNALTATNANTGTSAQVAYSLNNSTYSGYLAYTGTGRSGYAVNSLQLFNGTSGIIGFGINNAQVGCFDQNGTFGVGTSVNLTCGAGDSFNVTTGGGLTATSGTFNVGSTHPFAITSDSSSSSSSQICYNGSCNDGFRVGIVGSATSLFLDTPSGVSIGFRTNGTNAVQASVDGNGFEGRIGGTTPAAGAFTSATITGATPTVSSGQLGLGTTTATTATAGSATLPSLPVGFLDMNLGGTTIKIPYYAN